MNTADVRIQDVGGLNAAPTYPQSLSTVKWATKAGNTALNPGEICKMDVANGIPYVKVVATGDGTTGGSLVGVVASKDSVTASADGAVDVYFPVPNLVYAIKAKSATAANTDAKVLALIGKRPLLDVTSSKITLDTSQADSAANTVRIIGGNSATNELYVVFAQSGTFLNETVV